MSEEEGLHLVVHSFIKELCLRVAIEYLFEDYELNM